jgi:hypothetical protein
MKNEHIVELGNGHAYRFTKDMTHAKTDFFIMYFMSILIDKNLDKFQYLLTVMELAPKLRDINEDLKEVFYDAFWNEKDAIVKDITHKVYNIINESTKTT